MQYQVEYDKHLNKYTVFYQGDELVFSTKAEAKAFIDNEAE